MTLDSGFWIFPLVSGLSKFLDGVGLQRAPFKGRMRVYQLMTRHFGNANESRVPDGSREENGCGHFLDVNEEALGQIKGMGFTHLWLTGALDHATGTSYPGLPGDEPGILKGKAGSPYAVRDYFNVSPDLAVEPENRLGEFRDLLDRCQEAGLRVLIDLVPNHVARSYKSVTFPEESFGLHDRRELFFHPDNHFYYLPDSPTENGLILPDGSIFEPERKHGKVTGNNCVTWNPSKNDWYETVKLNYGHDFTKGPGDGDLPAPGAKPEEVPRTWRDMDRIIAYWLKMGVDGFRVDMAHLVPPAFWRWAVPRARMVCEGATFIAEAYDDDPAKLSKGNILDELLAAGFDAVYDQPGYRAAKALYEEGKWANDLAVADRDDPRRGKRLRYVENHDEVRVANPGHWGGRGGAGGPGGLRLAGPFRDGRPARLQRPGAGREGRGRLRLFRRRRADDDLRLLGRADAPEVAELGDLQRRPPQRGGKEAARRLRGAPPAGWRAAFRPRPALRPQRPEPAQPQVRPPRGGDGDLRRALAPRLPPPPPGRREGREENGARPREPPPGRAHRRPRGLAAPPGAQVGGDGKLADLPRGKGPPGLLLARGGADVNG